MCYEEGQLYLAGLVATTLAAPERSYSGCWYPPGERQRVNVSKVDASTEKEDATPSRLARGDAHRWVCYQDGPRSVQHGAGPRRNWPSLATEKASAFLLTTAAQTSQTMSRNTGVTGVMILSRKAFDKRLWGNPHAVGECSVFCIVLSLKNEFLNWSALRTRCRGTETRERWAGRRGS